MNNLIVPSLGETLLCNNFDIATDYLELTLDAITTNGALRDIPFVRTLVGVGETAIAVRDRHLLKKTLEFVRQVNCGNISDETREKYRKKIIEKDANMQRELEHVLLLIDNFIDGEKSKKLAKFYLKYVDGEMEWEDFCIFGEILDTISIHDFKALEYMYEKKYLYVNDCKNVNSISIYRMASVGLIEHFAGRPSSVNGEKNVIALITDVGSNFYEIANG